jgi:energy-coupling factor transporter ATP-binding protein EcfA2
MFELDSNFNETIKSRHRDDFSYASFSEGEKMRINLAILFTWRAVAKLRNSASCNLLIMDEVLDGSLDGNGTDEFLKILNNLTLDTNTYIISHKVDQMHDKFANVIKFEKHKNFSRIAG